MTKQFRVYKKLVYSKGSFKADRFKNPFDDQWTRVIEGDIKKHYEHVAEVSMKRTKKKVYDYARCNHWEWFVTFTLSPDKVDRYSYDLCIKKLKGWLDHVRRSSPALSYLVVPEQHKDGAWHFHGLFTGLDDKQIVWTGRKVIKRSADGKRFVSTQDKIYKFGSYGLGWMTATAVRDQARVVSYVCKYITKDLCAISHGRRRYWSSRNLLTPQEEVYELDKTERMILCTELQECASYSKTSVMQYGDYTQTVSIYDV